MILNAYAVLDAFLSLGRLLVGLLVLGFGVSAWRMTWREPTPERSKALEDRVALLYLLASLLLGLNLVAWPLLYLLLQSYVPEWPGVMCIYGVTQVGAGSLGPSRFLPALLQTLQVTKPALVFAGGAWLVLHAVNRRTASGPLLGRVLLALTALGLLAEVDAVAELAYLAIPKQEEFLAVGCCTAGSEAWGRADRFLPASLLREHDRPWLWAAYFVVNLGMVFALGGCARRLRQSRALPRLAPLLLGAVLAAAVSAAFLTEVAAPRLLHLPGHHCAYDLIPQAPGAVLAVVLFLGGSFAVGWACAAGWWARAPETEPFLPAAVGGLLVAAMWSYLGSLVIMSLELLRAGAVTGLTG
jgi:hypothetical protein